MVAASATVPSVFTVAVAGETDTASGVTTVTLADPNLVESCVDVAFTVTVPGAFGAVKTPVALIVPALALQLTAEL